MSIIKNFEAQKIQKLMCYSCIWSDRFSSFLAFVFNLMVHRFTFIVEYVQVGIPHLLIINIKQVTIWFAYIFLKKKSFSSISFYE